MFLSSTDQSPPNISSSCNLTNSSDELGQSHLSSFSIRDYAFSNRTKDIKKSWPFSSASLQLCLGNGLSDPLPPIQHLGSVISHLPEAVSLTKPNEAHVQEALSDKRKSEKLLASNQAKEGLENVLLATNTNGAKSKIQVAIDNKNPRKKFGLIMKPGACVDSGPKEDHSCLFSASDLTALRTCPICKTFSSASNTTLNAHIDQCLSVGSVQQPTSKPNRPRGKPRMKVKTMVEIYASAKGCTLEDLDKRNGTNWAMVSSSKRVISDNNHQMSKKEKKRRVLRVPVAEDVAGIGPVYIDAKGQKLRILSEVSEKTSDPLREHEDVNEKKSSSQDKRIKGFRKGLDGNKCYKYRPHSRKNALHKCSASKVPDFGRGDSEEGRGMKRSKTLGPDEQGILNQRMRTKHDLATNGNKKERVLRHSVSGDPLVLRGPSHVSTDSSDTDSSPLNSHNSWRICGESQVSGKSSLSRRKISRSASFVANPLRRSIPTDKVMTSAAKGVMKLKKAQLDLSEYKDEDTGKWESGTSQERELTDYDDWNGNGKTDKVLLSSNPSITGQDNDSASYEETGNNSKGDDNMLDKTDDADVEFVSRIYAQAGSEFAERGSLFVEVDPIPIPGPPGSFLPSPWDMATDATENHGKPSVITSQVYCSQEQLDLTDSTSSESPVSAISNFAAPQTQTFISFHNINSIDKRPSRSINSDQCCCQRKGKASEDTVSMQPPPHIVLQESKPLPAIPSNSNPVLRLMGKDLMITNQREEPSLGESSLTPTSQFLDLSKRQQRSPPVRLHHHPYDGKCLHLDTNNGFYNIP